MNTKILAKCVDELKKDAPDLSYVRGMLETLIDLGEPIQPLPTVIHSPIPNLDEQEDSYATRVGPIGRL